MVGSITHTGDYCAAALLDAQAGLSIGIDAERDDPGSKVAALLLSPREQRHVADLHERHPGRRWARLLFSAKEAFHKALFPRSRLMLDFLDVNVTVDARCGRFDVCLEHPASAQAAGGRQFTGRFRFQGALVLSTAVVPL